MEEPNFWDNPEEAQKQTIELDVHELAAICDIGCIARNDHFIDGIRQCIVAADLKNTLFHSFSLHLSIKKLLLIIKGGFPLPITNF